MKGKEATRFRRGDAVTIALVIAAALGMILVLALTGGSEENLRVQIRKDGEVIRELPLDTDAVISVEGDYANTVVIRDGQVAITESNCPGEDCVHSGWIRRSGRSIVCLPNRVEVRITGGTPAEDDVDAVVR